MSGITDLDVPKLLDQKYIGFSETKINLSYPADFFAFYLVKTPLSSADNFRQTGCNCRKIYLTGKVLAYAQNTKNNFSLKYW